MGWPENPNKSRKLEGKKGIKKWKKQDKSPASQVTEPYLVYSQLQISLYFHEEKGSRKENVIYAPGWYIDINAASGKLIADFSATGQECPVVLKVKSYQPVNVISL